MLYIAYDRNFRENTQQTFEWEVGKEVLDIEPHRVIQIDADGDEKKYLDELMGGSLTTKDTVCFYGDMARTVYLNL